MPLTVQELIDTPSLGLRVLVAGDLAQPIRWVHATEQADPTPFLRGGEVVLTDGVQFRGGASPVHYARRLRDAGVAAVGYGLLEDGDAGPPELRAGCDAVRLTLFEVPVPVPYMAIAEVFVESLNAERRAPLEASVERSARLMAAATAGRGLDATLEVLAAELGGPACLLDPQGRLVASVGDSPPEALRAALRDGGARGWTVSPVTSIDRAEALLAVRCPLGVEQRAAIDQVAAFLALQLVHERALRETHRRFAVEVLDLAEAGDGQAAAVATRLRAFGIAPDAPLVVVACETAEPEQHIEEVERTLAAAGLAALAAARARHLFAVVQWEAESRELPELAERLACATGAAVPIGVGGVAQTSRGLGGSLSEALHACAIARRRDPQGYVTHDEMGSHRLLLALQDAHVVSSLSSALLDPIADYDARRQTELLHTLSAFLESNGQWQATADALHVHVNTLRNRIARIEELSGRSLDTMDGRVDLFLALRSRSLPVA
jgi:hypothetical protein